MLKAICLNSKSRAVIDPLAAEIDQTIRTFSNAKQLEPSEAMERVERLERSR